MPKNTQIHLNGQLFNLEETAYQKLQTYLETVENYFSKQENSKEIIDDFKNGIADHLAQKTHGQKKIITETEILNLIKTVGTVEDFETVKSGPDNHDLGVKPEDTHKKKWLRIFLLIFTFILSIPALALLFFIGLTTLAFGYWALAGAILVILGLAVIGYVFYELIRNLQTVSAATDNKILLTVLIIMIGAISIAIMLLGPYFST